MRTRVRQHTRRIDKKFVANPFHNKNELVIFPDEDLVTFSTSLGAITGVATVSKHDIPKLRKFGKESKATVIWINGRRVQ